MFDYFQNNLKESVIEYLQKTKRTRLPSHILVVKVVMNYIFSFVISYWILLFIYHIGYYNMLTHYLLLTGSLTNLHNCFPLYLYA